MLITLEKYLMIKLQIFSSHIITMFTLISKFPGIMSVFPSYREQSVDLLYNRLVSTQEERR